MKKSLISLLGYQLLLLALWLLLTSGPLHFPLVLDPWTTKS